METYDSGGEDIVTLPLQSRHRYDTLKLWSAGDGSFPYWNPDFPLLKPQVSPTESQSRTMGKKSPESLVVDDTWHIWHIISKTLRVPLRKHVRITILLKNASYLSLCPNMKTTSTFAVCAALMLVPWNQGIDVKV